MTRARAGRVWVPVLCVLLGACSSTPRQAPVQERSPVLSREALPPVLPRAGTGTAPPARTLPPPHPSGSATSGLAPPQAVAQAEEPTAVTSPLRPEGAPPRLAGGREPASSAGPANSATPSPLPSLDWSWPVDAPISMPFSETRKGVDFSGNLGDPVRAVATGTVTYVGNSLRGYGRMVVVTHEKGFLSVYAHNRTILVKEGQRVERGMKIAEMGHTDSNEVVLHFELRHQGRALDPGRVLPAR